MPSFNRVMLIGRLTRDPEMRYTSTGLPVTSFSIAVDRRSKNQQGEKVTDFFRCTAWQRTAEFVNEYVKKGRLVAVDGRIELSEYTANDGTRKNGVDIVCDNVETLDSQRDGEGGAGSNYPPRDQTGEQAGQARPAARPPANEDNGYFPDEDAAPAAPQRAARPAQAPAARGAAPAAAPAAAAPARGGAARPPAKPAETYPSDDFDDSDPFADE